jgi:hypothetical protein
VEKLENLSSLVAVESVLELSNCRWNFQSHVEDLALTLESDIFWPSDHTREVAPRLNILANSEVAGTLFGKTILETCQCAMFFE